MKIKIGDQVLITAGKDKGQKGKILKVFPKLGRTVVEGKNIYKKFRKGTGGQKGQVLEFSRPLPFANIALICPKCSKQTRVGYEVDKKGEKTRICKKCGAAV